MREVGLSLCGRRCPSARRARRARRHPAARRHGAVREVCDWLLEARRRRPPRPSDLPHARHPRLHRGHGRPRFCSRGSRARLQRRRPCNRTMGRRLLGAECAAGGDRCRWPAALHTQRRHHAAAAERGSSAAHASTDDLSRPEWEPVDCDRRSRRARTGLAARAACRRCAYLGHHRRRRGRGATFHRHAVGRPTDAIS